MFLKIRDKENIFNLKTGYSFCKKGKELLRHRFPKFRTTMKTLSLSIELSKIALESNGLPMSQAELLDKVQGILLEYSNELGRLTGSSEYQKSLGSDLQLNEYQFDYEQYSVQVRLANFMPRGGWQVQGVRLV